jgi:ArsR family metal-binding transcriptional regulator
MINGDKKTVIIVYKHEKAIITIYNDKNVCITINNDIKSNFKFFIVKRDLL